jgi:hypothetical protein
MEDTSPHEYAASGLPVPQKSTFANYHVRVSSRITSVSELFDRTQGKLHTARYALFMTQYWSISITIPGEYFTMENHTEKAVETKNDWTAPELKKINVEEVTSYTFKLGEDENDS